MSSREKSTKDKKRLDFLNKYELQSKNETLRTRELYTMNGQGVEQSLSSYLGSPRNVNLIDCNGEHQFNFETVWYNNT